MIDLLDEISLIKNDSSGIFIGYYIQLLIKNNRDYNYLLDQLLNKLNDDKIDIILRVKICRSIITTNKFYQ